MTDDLPPELEALERALAARPAPPLPPGLRRRVLDAARARPPWGLAAAAGAVLWIAASLVASRSSDLVRWTPPPRIVPTRPLPELPGLDAGEARRLTWIESGRPPLFRD